MQLTRRKLAAALLAPPAAALAQNQPPGAAAGPLDQARQNLQKHVSKLAAVDVPMTTEPAFQFKA